MNVENVTTMMSQASHLLTLSATYQARYGRNAKLKAGSPQDAWDLYDQTLYGQSIIARMLHESALESPYYKVRKWWEAQDVIDVGVARLLVQEVSHLLASVAYHEATADPKKLSHSVQSAQYIIAGMLHPSSILVAMDETVNLERYAS